MHKLNQAEKYLIKADPILGKVIKAMPLAFTQSKVSHFQSLVESIVSQQLSVKASDTIFKRFCGLFPKGKFPKPEQVLKMSDKKMRSVGLSGQKTLYIKDLATHVIKGQLKIKKLDKLPNEEVITELVAVKGIGKWTAEMFLMFHLERPDVFSHGDLGLRNAIIKLYKIRGELTQTKAESISKKWSPYRTVACIYLLASLG